MLNGNEHEIKKDYIFSSIAESLEQGSKGTRWKQVRDMWKDKIHTSTSHPSKKILQNVCIGD